MCIRSRQDSHWPGSATSGCGWPAPAFSVALQHPWLSAAPFVTFGCSPQRLSGWCLYSSASLCRCWSITIRMTAIINGFFFQISVSLKKNDWNKNVDAVKTYGSLDFGIKVPSSLMRSLMLNLRLLSTEASADDMWREGHTRSWLQTRNMSSRGFAPHSTLYTQKLDISYTTSTTKYLNLPLIKITGLWMPTYWGYGCLSSVFLST